MNQIPEVTKHATTAMITDSIEKREEGLSAEPSIIEGRGKRAKPAFTNELIPAKDIAWMRRRKDGAYNRYMRTVEELDETVRTLKRKAVEYEQDNETKSRKLTASEMDTLRMKRKDLNISKLDLQDGYRRAKREYLNACQQNYRLRRLERKDNKEEQKLLKTVSQLIEVAAKTLNTAAESGLNEQLEHLQFLAEQSKKKDFRKKTVELLTSLDPDTWEKILKYKSLEEAITGGVFIGFRSSGKSNRE